MLKYIIRLDDATPMMNKDAWTEVESMLGRNNIQPIVGIIPDSRDPLFDWNEDLCFWNVTVQRWIEKNWIIAQHGYHHVFRDRENNVHSEYIGLDYSSQKENIKTGYNVLISHNCKPICFYAPAHSFDDITIDVCRDLGCFEFISDGHALYPYKYREMTFLPQLFDTPHTILPFGVYTFIMHPNFSSAESIEKYESFIKKHRKHFLSSDELMEIVNTNRKRSFIDKAIEHTMNGIRKIRH